jgi:hypothetical protein
MHRGVEFGTSKTHGHCTSNGFAAPLEGPRKQGGLEFNEADHIRIHANCVNLLAEIRAINKSQNL